MKTIYSAALATFALALAALMLMALASHPARAAGPWYEAQAASITVNTTADELNGDGDCSLREAIQATNTDTAVDACPAGSGADTITLPAGTYTLTLAGAGEEANATGDLDITGPLTLDGADQVTTIIDANNLDRALHVPTQGVTLTLLNLTVRNGGVTDNGGGLYAVGPAVVSNTTFHSNTADGGGGAYFGGAAMVTSTTFLSNVAGGYGGGGGAYFNGAATVTGTTFTSNATYSYGGGAWFNGAATVAGTTFTNNTANYTGGGARFDSSARVADTAFTNNAAPSGEGGGIYSSGTLSLTSSVVSGNTTSGYGGGIFNSGALTLNNSTVSGNTVSGNGGGIFNHGVLVLNSSTVSGNLSGYGGGIKSDSNTVTLRNTILAGNMASGVGPDCTGAIGSLGHNLIGNMTGCSFTPTTGDLVNVDPKIDQLQDNGGPTSTHALLPSSPAINAGDPVGCMGSAGLLAADQRGFPRFGRCDIGAYETQPIAFSTKTANKPLALPGGSLSYTIVLTNGGSANIPDVVVTDTLPISLTYVSNSLTASSGNYAYNSGIIAWTGSVNAGEMVSITFEATVNQSVPLGTSVVNASVIHGAGETFTRTVAFNVDYYRIYLPLDLKKYPRGIHGRVTLNGTPVAGVPLELRFFNGSSWSTRATTATDADGDYSFLGLPSLTPGQRYYVRYRNYAGTPGRLWVWGTRELTSYAAGSDVEIGNFDIADIALVAPADGATVSLPYTFQWTPRPATPSDMYEFDLYDPFDLDPYIFPIVGYVSSYTLNTLPPGFNVGDLYVWEIWVYSPDGGFGISYETRVVFFANSGAAAVEGSEASVRPGDTAQVPARHELVPDDRDGWRRR